MAKQPIQMETSAEFRIWQEEIQEIEALLKRTYLDFILAAASLLSKIDGNVSEHKITDALRQLDPNLFHNLKEGNVRTAVGNLLIENSKITK